MPTQPAILGSARLGNFRLGYVSTAVASVRATRVRVILAGVLANARIRMAGLTIRDALNDAPNTCSLKVDGTAPAAGQSLRVSVNIDVPVVLFAGTLQTVDQSYEGKPNQLAWPCNAIDDTARANMKRPLGTWVNISATTIGQSLVADFASAFSDAGIEAILPPVSITFDGSESFISALARLANMIGGYCKVEDGVVYLFLTDTANQPDDIDSTPGRFLNDPPITMSEDVSQLRTRVYGKGYGENVTTDVAAGETIIPLPIGDVGNPLGGQAITGTTPDGAQSQVIDYTGVDLGGSGTLVGPGAAPASAPVLTPAAGTGVTLGGGHDVTVVHVTAGGRSIPSPVATIEVYAHTVPANTPSLSSVAGSNGNNWGTVKVQVTFIYADGTESLPSPLSSGHVLPSTEIPRVGLEIGPAGVVGRRVWLQSSADLPTPYTSRYAMLFPGGSPILNNNTATTADVSFGGGTGTIPSSDTVLQQIGVTGIALGPTSPVATTARELYMSPAGGGARKLALTISNNTATTGTITISDATLAGNAAEPTGDTSGLTQPSGQVLAGSTSLLTASSGPFASGGGWVNLGGGQTTRYTGITGNTLTGIPASGPGSILTTVLYGSQAIPSPALTGVTGLTLPMLKGSAVHIWVQRDDVTAQAAQAARAGSGDGVVEFTIFDGRRGEASLIARCDADLALFAYPIVTVRYACRDVKSKSGKPVVFNLTSPLISQTLTIQDVTIDQIDIAPGLAPRFMVTASSVRWSLEDTLRRLVATERTQ